jgi:hypothetical protein
VQTGNKFDPDRKFLPLPVLPGFDRRDRPKILFQSQPFVNPVSYPIYSPAAPIIAEKWNENCLKSNSSVCPRAIVAPPGERGEPLACAGNPAPRESLPTIADQPEQRWRSKNP